MRNVCWSFQIHSLHYVIREGARGWRYELLVQILAHAPCCYLVFCLLSQARIVSTDEVTHLQGTLARMAHYRLSRSCSLSKIQHFLFHSNQFHIKEHITNIKSLLTTNICLFLPCPCSLNTVILLWTLYYTKHRNWFLESFVMLEIFIKLPLKI